MTPRTFRILVIALLAVALVGAAHTAQAQVTAQLLIISADGTEPSLPAIRATLEYLGTPFHIWIATREDELNAERLYNGSRAFWQGVILTTGDLGYSTDGGVTRQSALSPAEWDALRAYQAQFGIRQVTWYTYPSAGYGFAAPSGRDTSVAPLAARLTTAGQAVFPYVNRANPLVIEDAFTYLARPLDAATTPLLTDAAGNALAAVRRYPDGRENLALTFEGNEHLTHSLVLAYGLVNWVTRGLFVGQRRIHVSAQIDDILLASDLFVGGQYRMTQRDLEIFALWQVRRMLQPVTRGLMMQFGFNGAGANERDALSRTIKKLRPLFKWINHTFTHDDLDDASYAKTMTELQQNHNAARQLGLADSWFDMYDKVNLITPEMSGLDNPEVMRAARDFGIRYVVSNASRHGMGNPSPNAGIYNRHEPGILMIPRYPSNLFYNVTTPGEWVAEYNYLYGAAGVMPPPAGWGRDLSYDEIVEVESEALLHYMLRGDTNPWMFHQGNLRAFDGARSLLSDLLGRTLDKYNRLFNLPVQSPTMDDLGQRFADRMSYNAAGVGASIVPGVSITLTAERAAVVPVTGLRTQDAELYGGQYVSFVRLAAGQSLTLPLVEPRRR
jgi:hypothetical protein